MNAMQEQHQAAIAAMVRASNRLAAKGYVSSHGGNLSWRIGAELVLITPTKVPKDELAFDDIVAVDMDGAVVFAAPGRRPTGEMPMHLHLYRKRPDLNAIVHSHPPVLTGFAIAHSDLLARPLLPEVVIEIGPVLSVDYAQPLSQALADAFDPVLDRSNAFLMRNHGVMVCAREGVDRALQFTEMLEGAAVSLATAVALGAVNSLTAAELRDLDEVLRIRNMALPGAPGRAKSLRDVFQVSLGDDGHE